MFFSETLNAKMQILGPDETGAATVSSTPNRKLYSVCELNLEQNKNEVLNIWKQSGFNVPEAKYSWMYENNPYGPATGWLVRNSGGQAVGVVALFPRGIRVKGELRSAALVGDFVITKEHRSLGPALMLQRAAVQSPAKHNFDFIYGIPNRQAEAVLLRAGYRQVGLTIRMTKPFRSHYYLRRKLSSSLLADTLAGAIDPILHWTAKEIRQSRNNRFRLEEMWDFDQRFDDLSGLVSDPMVIVGERNAAYLRWRYLRCPHKKYRIHALTDVSTQQILGFLVSYAEGEGIAIAELQAIEHPGAEGPGIMDCLLSEFLRVQRQQTVDSVSISYFGSKRLSEKLKEYGFAHREANENLVVFAGPDARLADQLLDQHNWCLFEGDVDA